MSFWDEIKEDETQNNTSTEVKGIYKTKQGFFRVYYYRKGKSNYVGRYDTFEEAYEAQINFAETGEKQLVGTKGKPKKTQSQINEELKSLINEHPESPTPKLFT